MNWQVIGWTDHGSRLDVYIEKRWWKFRRVCAYYTDGSEWCSDIYCKKPLGPVAWLKVAEAVERFEELFSIALRLFGEKALQEDGLRVWTKTLH